LNKDLFKIQSNPLIMQP